VSGSRIRCAKPAIDLDSPVNKHFDWIRANLTEHLAASEDELSQSIVALYLLSMELSINSPAVYLDRDAANHLPEVVRCFETHSFREGLDWIASLEMAYGMAIHPDVDTRADYIMDSTEAQRRLDAFNDESVATIRMLVPKINALLDDLVEQKLAERQRLG
jgi:hypothetical protein